MNTYRATQDVPVHSHACPVLGAPDRLAGSLRYWLIPLGLSEQVSSHSVCRTYYGCFTFSGIRPSGQDRVSGEEGVSARYNTHLAAHRGACSSQLCCMMHALQAVCWMRLKPPSSGTLLSSTILVISHITRQTATRTTAGVCRFTYVSLARCFGWSTPSSHSAQR